MGKIFVKQHLGLGDNIIHNGMVRLIALFNFNNKIIVPSKPHNYENIKFMYRDVTNIEVIEVIDDIDMDINIYNNKYDTVISTHLVNSNNQYSYDDYFDDSFYLNINMDPSVKKTFFHIQRDLNKENEVYSELVNPNEEYIFLHEKPDSGVVINRDFLPKDVKIIYADPKYKIFDLLTVIERAKECHFISSSFISLMLCKKYNQNVYAHMYSDVSRVKLGEYISKNGINVVYGNN